MIWFSLVLTFISVGGSLGSSATCSEKESECDRSLIPRSFPNTAEELMTMCLNVQTYGNCMEDAKESCGRDEEEVKEIRGIIGHLKELCDDDNQTYSAIANNLECIIPTSQKVDRRFCATGSFEEEEETIIEKHLEELYEEDFEEEFHQCLRYILDVSCMSIVFSHSCGSEVGNAVEEVLSNVLAWGVECSDEIVEKLRPFYEVYEATLLEGLAMNEDIDKRRK